MKKYKYLIIGAGTTAGYAAKEFVENGLSAGELALIGAEPSLPYNRPPLTKEYLAGKKSADEMLVNPPEFYRQHGLAVMLRTVVESVDLGNKTVHTSTGDVGFEKLLIATGARPRCLDLPGADLKGIHYMRRVEDAENIRAAAKQASNAVVLGGSFIGMEVASVLSSSGLSVTMVFPEERVWQAFFTREISSYFADYYRKRGVTIMPGSRPRAFEGEDGKVSQVILRSGQALPADLVVAGIGVQPNIELFKDMSLDLDDGVLVDSFLQTAVPDVYAAGDVACYMDRMYETRRRFEHWDNAVAQGRLAARNMLGERQPFVHIPYFFSDVFDLSYEYWGETSQANHYVLRGNFLSGSFSVWWLSGDRLVAAFVMDRPDEERQAAQEWIENGRSLSGDELSNERLPLKAAEILETAF
jgi:3-phenylpropionate/trans-cinnamate dioxygenase ferredoxin reductase subunit